MSQVGFPLVEEAVGERVFPSGVRSICLFDEVDAADDTVVVVTEQSLDGRGGFGHFRGASHFGDVAQSFGALTNRVECRVTVLGVGDVGALCTPSDLLIAVFDSRLRPLLLLLLLDPRSGRLGGDQVV